MMIPFQIQNRLSFMKLEFSSENIFFYITMFSINTHTHTHRSSLESAVQVKAALVLVRV